MDRRKSFKAVKVLFPLSPFVDTSGATRLKELGAPQQLIDGCLVERNRISIVADRTTELGLSTVKNEYGYTFVDRNQDCAIKYISYKNSVPVLLIAMLNTIKDQGVITAHFFGTVHVDQQTGRPNFVPVGVTVEQSC